MSHHPVLGHSTRDHARTNKNPGEDVHCSPCGSQVRGNEPFSENHSFFKIMTLPGYLLIKTLIISGLHGGRPFHLLHSIQVLELHMNSISYIDLTIFKLSQMKKDFGVLP